MGERRPIEPELAAEALLRNGDGSIVTSWHVPERVALSTRLTISFDSYVRLEATLLSSLLQGDEPSRVFRCPPGLAPLDGLSWSDASDLFDARDDGVTRALRAMGLFADGIRAELGHQVALRSRPWEEEFDRAERDGPATGTITSVIGDFLADRLWHASWAAGGTLSEARAELTMLAVVSRRIADELVAIGARPDRAAAEAVMIAELASTDPVWRFVGSKMRRPPITAEWLR